MNKLLGDEHWYPVGLSLGALREILLPFPTPPVPYPSCPYKRNTITHTMCVCTCVHVCAHTPSCIWLSATPWIVVHQSPLSMKFSRQEYWNGFPFPTSRDLPYPRTKPTSLASPELAGGFFSIAPPGKPYDKDINMLRTKLNAGWNQDDDITNNP